MSNTLVVPLPKTTSELMAQRIKVIPLTRLNDLVEDVVLVLIEDEAFKGYLEAVYDEQAVEGSLSTDNIFAAMMIRDYARAHGIPQIAKEKAHVISRALNIVAKRYGMGRKERRVELGGEPVSMANAAD